MTYHCLFEQSGTFKNVLKDNGHTAYDYDILNDFGETDFVIDLFGEIDKAYDKLLGVSDKPSIFDDMSPETDFIIAFFPCTYFCDANSLRFRRYNGGKRLPFDLKCSETLIKRNANRARFFELYIKFCAVCQIKGLKAIIENPASGGATTTWRYSVR